MYAWSKWHEMIDTFTETNQSYVWQILDNTWYSTYNVIPNAMSVPNLKKFSNWKPNNVSTVVVMWTKEWASITSNIPSTYKRSDVAWQIVYHVVREYWKPSPGTDHSIEYLDYNKTSDGTQTFKYNVGFFDLSNTDQFFDNA